MNNTTNTATTAKFNKMVLDFKKAMFASNTAKLGSDKQMRADAKMEALTAKAEAEGFLQEFCRAAMDSNNKVSLRFETEPYEVATDREEWESCEAGTEGCCVRHDGKKETSCQTW